ncbi:o-succinylbenzoate synthase [Halobaculum sp. CBA1158]|uniref:mandelate racemase/muconate lactonizing enzyme family protein n=1 Tax=Halobaculum sp. CBA1158 TaxID=2904243 RepID=UPI001F3CF85E|nr:enolase C-terminal domain-like protein [Halobaculum sp. CBA1158]UIO99173.1 o-succinylbenzoate synthase [Halobaculum sp. CBA1158]
MTVRALREFALELAAPLSTARGDIERREGLLVRVDLAGTPGVGEAAPLPGWTESLADCRRALERARDEGTPPGSDSPAARHAVALAYRDAFARRRGESLAASLTRAGEDDREPAASVPVNGTVGDADRDEAVAAAREAVTAGHRCVKLKVGARSLEADLARVRAVADAVGAGADGTDPAADRDGTDGTDGTGGVALRVDANGAWDRPTAREAVSALAGVVEYVEQPLPAGDLAGHASLRGVGAPVALDESLTRHGVGDVLAAGAADAVVLKPMALGGPSRALAAGRAAAHAGVAPVVTTTVDAAVARTAAVHVAAALPRGAARAHGLATGDLLALDLAGDDPAPVADGRIAVPSGPGLAGDAFDDLFADGT